MSNTANSFLSSNMYVFLPPALPSTVVMLIEALVRRTRITQIPPALALALITIILPYSPRWLASKERHEEAKKVMYKLHGHRGADTIETEFAEMCQQIQLEKSNLGLRGKCWD